MKEIPTMVFALLISSVLLWLTLLFVAFVLLGSLRSMDVLRWQMQQLQATTPSRMGRNGLRPGKKAPDFKLPCAVGPEMALSDFAGRKVFLVFVQTGCGPCGAVVPDLNRMYRDGKFALLVVNNGEPDKVREWVGKVNAEFPVLIQDRLAVSKKYEVLATPFAFLIDEKGIIRSKGIVNSKQQIEFVLDGRRDEPKADHGEAQAGAAEASEFNDSESLSKVKEVVHV
jgi:methylamine dehydrogenase accessory protein MauD